MSEIRTRLRIPAARYTRHSLRDSFTVSFALFPFVVPVIGADYSARLDASVGASSARFPKFVHSRGAPFANFGKQRALAKFNQFPSAAFDLKFPVRTRGMLCGNIKSAALAPRDIAVRNNVARLSDVAASIASRAPRS